MRNPELADLNFRHLLDYGGQPNVQNTYQPPLNCKGYCIACEESDIFNDGNGIFDQMSHGCDTSDYEVLLGRIDEKEIISHHVMFLLENPGGDYGNGSIIPYKGCNKQPPVNHYYWTPNIDYWPKTPYSLDNLYGPYFAYLMKRHGLNNVYITNLIKCNTITSKHTEYNKDSAIEICTNKWLLKEIGIFKPKCVFCFGRNAEKGFIKSIKRFGLSIPALYLYHPSAIDLAQRYRKSKREMLDENDVRISKYLGNIT